MYTNMCFACIAAVLTNHRIGSYKNKNICKLCIEFICLIEICGLLIVYIVSTGGYRAICLRIFGLQALFSALYPFGPLPSVSNPL